MKNEKILLIAILVILGIILVNSFGFGNYGMMSWMFGSGFGFMWIFMFFIWILFIVFLVLGILWLIKQLQKK